MSSASRCWQISIACANCDTLVGQAAGTMDAPGLSGIAAIAGGCLGICVCAVPNINLAFMNRIMTAPFIAT
jgi:hypothetical protein